MPVAAAIKATTALKINTVAQVIDNMANAIISTSSCHASVATGVATSIVGKTNIQIANPTLVTRASGINESSFCNSGNSCSQGHEGSGCDDVASDDILTATLLAAAVAAVNKEGFQQTTSVPSTKASTIQSTITTDTQLLTEASLPTTSNVISCALSTSAANSMTTTNSCTVTPTTTSGQLLLNGLVSGCVNSNNNSNNIHMNSSNNYNSQRQHMLTDDERALHLALELSLVNMNDSNTVSSAWTVASVPSIVKMQYLQNLQQLHQDQLQLQQEQHITKSQQLQQSINTGSCVSSTSNIYHTSQINNHTHSFLNVASSTPASSVAAVTTGLLAPTLEERSKKSQNMTECVPVPSSEHVAEIVGRQGCKIKALRAKTNTYIKTPVRGEEPVFVVTGRKEDVAKAKREILSAAEHFSLIRATRKPSYDGANNSLINAGAIGSSVHGNVVANGNNNTGNKNDGCSGIGKSSSGAQCIGGQITIQVRVPYRVVGLVVGPKGATIKHIQQETQTYIVTPSRDKEPIFEVTGLPDNVQVARKQIEAHIALRTGGLSSSANAANGLGDTTDAANTICKNNHSNSNITRIIDPSLHTINTLSQMLSDDINTDFLASFYKNGIGSTLDYVDTTNNNNNAPSLDLCNTSSLNLNSQLLMNSTLMTGRQQQQTYSNDYLQTLMSNSSTHLDMELQAQHLNMSHQEQDVSKLTSRSNNMFHSINTFNVNGIRSGIGGHKTKSTAAALANLNADISLNGSIITRSCSSASSTSSNKSLNNNNVISCSVNGSSIGVINANGLRRVADSNMGGSSSSNSSSSSSNSSTASSRPELINIWKHLGESIDVDEGIGESPNIWTTNLANTLQSNSLGALNGTGDGSGSGNGGVSGTIVGTHSPPNNSNSPTDSLLGEIHTNSISNIITNNQMAHHHFSCDNSIMHVQPQQKPHLLFGITANVNAGVMTSSPTVRRDCMVCNEKEVIAALVPCGHNMFCMECANRICLTKSATCPVCSVNVYHAMRILA